MRYYTLILFGLICNPLCSCEQKKGANQSSTYYETETSEYAVPSDEEQLAELKRICSKWPKESFEERFELHNPWHKDYFLNDWGEEIHSQPFIYTTLSGSSWDIHIDFSTSLIPNGAFRIYLLDSHGPTSMYDPVNIYVRGSDGETKNVPVDIVNESIAYIIDPATVEGLKFYLNNEQFDILMQFGKWNERHSTKAQWWSDPGFFQHAIDTML